MRANKRNSKIGIMIVGLTLTLFTFHLLSPAAAPAASAAEIDRDARAALASLYKKVPGAKALGDKAVAVLVFPSIVKGGFIVGGQYGDGALRKGGKTTAYYRSLAGVLWIPGRGPGVWLRAVFHGRCLPPVSRQNRRV